MKKVEYLFMLSLIIAGQLFWSSCASIDKDKEDAKDPYGKAGYKSKIMKNLKSEKTPPAETEPMSKEEVKVAESDKPRRVDRKIIEPTKTKRREGEFKRRPFYEKILKSKNEAENEVTVQLNLDAASLVDIIPVFSHMLDFSYLIDNKVSKTSVSIAIDADMTKREIWELFDHILYLSDSYCTYENGVVNIYPLARMPHERKLSIDHETEANVEVRLVHIIHAKSNDIVTQLKQGQFLSPGAIAINLVKENALLLVESPENIMKILEIIKLLDRTERLKWPKLALQCENIPSEEIKKELTQLLPILGYPVTADKAVLDPGSIHLTSLDRLGVLLASAANNESLEEIKRWVSILDRDDIGSQERLYVYKVVNSTAQELIKAVQVMFNTKGAPPKQKKYISVFEQPMIAHVDEVQNRLVVRTTPRAYAVLKALLLRLDTIPSQVLLQVMIAEINLNEENQFGLEFGFKGTTGEAATKVGTDWLRMNTSLNPEGEVVPNDYGINYLVQNSKDPDKFAYIRALAGENNTKVLSSPQIVAVSHTKAQFKVGDRVPIVNREEKGSNVQDQVVRDIQYQDTGIILNVTPHITKGGRIVIDLESTVSDAVKTTSSDLDSPTIQERVMKTTLSLLNGSTIMVGGLIWEKEVKLKESLPVIYKLPVISNLTGYNDINRKRVELLVLITAVIIDQKTDLQEQIRRYRNSVRGIEKMEASVEKW